VLDCHSVGSHCEEVASVLYIALAILPAFLLLAWLYTRDQLHPEPKHVVYRLFLLGAGIVLPAGLIERLLLQTGFDGAIHLGRWSTLFITTFFVAGMVEEFLKAAIVERAALQKGWMKTPIDAIIYSGATALGFAAVENLLYVTSAGFSTAILRSVTAVPAHLMFGIIMGTYFARSLWANKSRAWAYIVPALVHGLYDTFALSNSWIGDFLLFVYLIALLEQSLRRLDWATRLSKQIRPQDIVTRQAPS
jgi:RsiW-degrading membrane proteinase PrsW (M82 family)